MVTDKKAGNRRNEGPAAGRGRGGGRGNYGNRPSVISPNGKKAGDIGGSGPNVTPAETAQSNEWNRAGTKEDEEKLRSQIAAAQSAGAAEAENQP